MTADPLAEALAQLLASYSTDHKSGTDLGAKLLKKKEVKDGLAPIAKLFKYGGARREIVLERCLELPADHALHRAAADLIARGAIPWTPWASICTAVQPKRWTKELLVSKHEPVVYAREDAPRIAVWSLLTGAHETDLAVPSAKGKAVTALIELDDGTLRCITEDGLVCERAPGAKSFTKVHEIGVLRHGWAASEDLRFHVLQLQKEPIQTEHGEAHRIAVHDVVTKKSTELEIPASSTNPAFVRASGRVAIACRRVTKVARSTSREEHFVALVHLESGELESIPFDRAVERVSKGTREDALRIELASADESAGSDAIELDLATRAQTPVAPEVVDPNAHFLAMAGGCVYDPHTGVLRDAAGTDIGMCGIDGAWRTFGAWDAARGQLVLAGNDPEVPVTVIAPYDPARTANAPEPEKTQALAWSRPGTVLTYEIIDSDGRAAWSFEVLSNVSGLTLVIRMGDRMVADEAHFTEKALEDASAFVALARGGADVDLEKDQITRVPPIMFGRASTKRLVAGQKIPFRSEWTEKTSLDPASTGVARIVVDGEERAVSTLSATSEEGVGLTLLSDVSWPLVITRTEGDCSVRVVAIDTTSATDTPKARTRLPAPNGRPAGAVGESAVRRFELVDGAQAKFWEIAVAGPALTIRSGKVGSAGQTQTKDLGTAESAAREAEKMVREKTKKGYAEKAT